VDVYTNGEDGCLAAIGTEVWDAALLLCESLPGAPPPGRVLELGSGAGLAGCFLKKRGADVTLTDYNPAVLRLLRKSAGLVGARVLTLDWYRRETWGEEGAYDSLVGAALVYSPDHACVADVIKHCLRRGGEATLLQLSVRPGVAEFLRRCEDVGLGVEERRVDEGAVERAGEARGEIAGAEDFRIYTIKHI
jgi:SAM-dependent methyltransferase